MEMPWWRLAAGVDSAAVRHGQYLVWMVSGEEGHRSGRTTPAAHPETHAAAAAGTVAWGRPRGGGFLAMTNPAVADGASDLLLKVFGKEKPPIRIALGVATLPLGMPVEIEFVLEVA